MMSSKLLLSVYQLPRKSQSWTKLYINLPQRMSPGSAVKYGKYRHKFMYGPKYSRTATTPFVMAVVFCYRTSHKQLPQQIKWKSHRQFSCLYQVTSQQTDRQQDPGSETPKMAMFLNPNCLVHSLYSSCPYQLGVTIN